MKLHSIAREPLIVVSPKDTVMHAINATLPPKVGAVVVMENSAMVGIFTERDVMLKVVAQKKDPEQTSVGDVMTTPVLTVPSDTPPKDVLVLMLNRNIRHMPISDDGHTVEAMLTVRDLLFHLVDDLSADLEHMEAFIGADSPGG